MCCTHQPWEGRRMLKEIRAEQRRCTSACGWGWGRDVAWAWGSLCSQPSLTVCCWSRAAWGGTAAAILHPSPGRAVRGSWVWGSFGWEFGGLMQPIEPGDSQASSPWQLYPIHKAPYGFLGGGGNGLSRKFNLCCLLFCSFWLSHWSRGRWEHHALSPGGATSKGHLQGSPCCW